MKKIIIRITFIVIVFILIVLGIFFFNKYKEKYKNITPEAFTWDAKYIWLKENKNELAENKSNTWTCFRKKLNIENKKDIKNIVARIAVDSKYWLYINDEIVIREGRS